MKHIVRAMLILSFLAAMGNLAYHEALPWLQEGWQSFTKMSIAPTSGGIIMIPSAQAPSPAIPVPAPPAPPQGPEARFKLFDWFDIELGQGSGWGTIARLLALVLGSWAGVRGINLAFERLSPTKA